MLDILKILSSLEDHRCCLSILGKEFTYIFKKVKKVKQKNT